MKKEYIPFYFNACFKGRVDERLFNEAKSKLFFITSNSINLEITNRILHGFIKAYYGICNEIEEKLEIAEEQINVENFKQLSFIQKIKHIHNLKKLKKLHSDTKQFNIKFEQVLDIDIVEYINKLKNEESVKNTQNSLKLSEN